MKGLQILVVTIAMVLSAGTVLASDDKDGSKEDWSDFRMMMTERNKMVRSMMAMTRETMMIIRDMNHKPSADDKKKLDGMITDIDKLIEHDVETGKKMMKKWKKDDWGDKGAHGNM